LSAFHRVDDWRALAADLYFSLAVRLGAYAGIIAARIQAEHDKPVEPVYTPIEAVDRMLGAEW
jgi:hypothetical protein